MKNSLNIFFVVIIFFFVTFESFSQIYTIETGLNFSNIIKENNTDYPIDYPFGVDYNIHIGIAVEYPIYKVFSLNTGIYFTEKGFKTKKEMLGPVDDVEETKNLNLYYLDIPLKVRTNFKLGNSKIYGFFGPYLGVGLFGNMKTKITDEYSTEIDKQDIKWWLSSNNDYNRFDFGIMAGTGINTSPIQIGLSYGLSLLKTTPIVDSETSAYNRNLIISVGYKFEESSFEKDNTYISLNPKTGLFYYLSEKKTENLGGMAGITLNYRHDDILLSVDYYNSKELFGRSDHYIKLLAGKRKIINDAVLFDMQLGLGFLWQHEKRMWMREGVQEYSRTTVTESTIGVLFNSGIKFSPTKYFAIGPNVQFGINPDYSYFAIPYLSIEAGFIR